MGRIKEFCVWFEIFNFPWFSAIMFDSSSTASASRVLFRDWSKSRKGLTDCSAMTAPHLNIARFVCDGRGFALLVRCAVSPAQSHSTSTGTGTLTPFIVSAYSLEMRQFCYLSCWMACFVPGFPLFLLDLSGSRGENWDHTFWSSNFFESQEACWEFFFPSFQTDPPGVESLCLTAAENFCSLEERWVQIYLSRKLPQKRSVHYAVHFCNWVLTLAAQHIHKEQEH